MCFSKRRDFGTLCSAHQRSALTKASGILPKIDCAGVTLVSTVSALIIEPRGTIIRGRSTPEIAGRSQVLSPQMIDPSGSMISAAMVRCFMHLMVLEMAGVSKD
jgi:hypothetical protein